MPVGGKAGAKRPNEVGRAQPRGDMRVVEHVIRVVIVNKTPHNHTTGKGRAHPLIKSLAFPNEDDIPLDEVRIERL